MVLKAERTLKYVSILRPFPTQVAGLRWDFKQALSNIFPSCAVAAKPLDLSSYAWNKPRVELISVIN
jgi:hypothetical protein